METLTDTLERLRKEGSQRCIFVGASLLSTHPEPELSAWTLEDVRKAFVCGSDYDLEELLDGLAQVKELRSLALVGLDIDDDGAENVARRLGGLTELSLGYNRIGDRGAAALAGAISGLTSLDLGANNVSDDGARAIAARANALSELDLGGNLVGDDGTIAIAKSLKQLVYLCVSFGRVGPRGAHAIAENLPNLTALDVTTNSVGDDGAQRIAERLTSLVTLEIAANKLSDGAGAAIARGLKGLKKLDLGLNGIGLETAKSIATYLKKLTYLRVPGTKIGDPGVREIARGCRSLEHLNVRNVGIGDVGALAIAESLDGLVELNISDNLIGDSGAGAIATRLIGLQSLELASTGITRIPEEVGKLRRLTTLDVSDNDVKALPEFLRELPELRSLRVKRNARLNLPAEIDHQSEPAAVFAWYFKPKRRLNEAKVLLVGQGGVGKTSLVNAIIRGACADPQEGKTERIRIDTWRVDARHEHETLKVNMWDFGGQEIMHATHQFFLTKRSVYVLVIDARQGELEGNIHYWLQTIQSFGGDSPVLVVTNKSDVQPLTLNENGIRKQYASMSLSFHRVSCKTLDGVDKLSASLGKTIRELPHVDDELPDAYFEVKELLESQARSRHFVDMPEYETLCEEHGLSDERERRRLLRFLHDIGTVLNFGDTDGAFGVGNTNILNPEWVTEGVYAIINNQQIMQAQGRLNLEDLPTILTDHRRYPPEKQRFIIEMMRKFELCFDYADSNKTLLVPELLSKNEPDINWKPPSECLELEYAYRVLPTGLIPRFIVRMSHALTDKPTLWRSGVVLGIDGAKVLVRGESGTQAVRVSVDGPPETRRSALAAVRNQFKAIHESMARLQVEERVPLPDAPNVSVPYSFLRQLEAMSRSDPTADRFYPEGLPAGWHPYSASKLLSGLADRVAAPPPTTDSEANGSSTKQPAGPASIGRLFAISCLFLLLLGGIVGAVVVEARLGNAAFAVAVPTTISLGVVGFVFLGYFSGLLKGPAAERLLNKVMATTSKVAEPEAKKRPARARPKPKKSG